MTWALVGAYLRRCLKHICINKVAEQDAPTIAISHMTEATDVSSQISWNMSLVQ